jgi:hypothetical protein
VHCTIRDTDFHYYVICNIISRIPGTVTAQICTLEETMSRKTFPSTGNIYGTSNQCCGTVTIYLLRFWSDFAKVSVPVPNFDPETNPDGI